MILIAHRGNLIGPKPELENNPEYILEALSLGYHAEVDLRMENGQLYLGHDEPQYPIQSDFLIRNKNTLWVHCKDHQAFEYMAKNNIGNFFWHDTDDYTFTKYGYIWAYPGKPSMGIACIMVMPELYWKLEEIKKFKSFGVCSDFVELLNT